MTKYQSVKVLFDLDDEYQAKLYHHLKNRTNGSSYVRTLIHLDINRDGQEDTSISNNTNAQPSNYPVFNEQINNDEPDIKTTNSQSIPQSIVKINSYSSPKEESIDDMDFSDLI